MIALTILTVITVCILFWYTGKSSVEHNNRVIEWMKQKNDKSGRYLI